MSRLTPKQLRFVDAYMLSSNGSAAYREAYSAEKMKDTSVRREASALLKKPAVAEEIERRRAMLAERNVISVESLTKALLETADEARGRGWLAGLAEQAKESGATINVSSLPLGAAVAAYKTVAQMHGLLTEKREISTDKAQFVLHIAHREAAPSMTREPDAPPAEPVHEPAARPLAPAPPVAPREHPGAPAATPAIHGGGHWSARELPRLRGDDESFDDFDSLLQERAD